MSTTRHRRAFGLLGVAGLLVAGCASISDAGGGNAGVSGADVSGAGGAALPYAEPDDRSVAQVPIAYGSYLAAQHARIRGDTRSASRFYREAIRLDPDNVLLLQQGFSLALAGGSYKHAEDLARRLVETSSANALHEMFLLLGAVREEQYEEAIARIDQITETGLNRLMKPLVAAWAYVGKGDFEAALAALEPLDETPSFGPFLRNHRAWILDVSGDREAAEDAYRESLSAEYRGSMRVVLSYAGLLVRQGRMEEARTVIEQAADLFPDTISLRNALSQLQEGALREPLIATPAEGLADAFYGGATALAQENARSPAIFYLRLALYLRPDFAEAGLVLGRIFEIEEQPVNALAIYEAIDDDASVADEARLREVWALEALGREEEALDRLRGLMNRSPGTVDTLSALANLLRQRNELDEAISQYTRAIDMAGDNENARHWVLYYARGLAFDQNEEWGRAEADFLKALALSPNQPDVLNYLGYSWVERGENMDRAHAMLEEAVVQRPNDGYIVDSLGWSHYRRGDLEQATEYLERAVLLRPENPTINEHLGDVYWMNGRRIEARFQWTHALSLGVDADQDRILRRKIADGLIDGNGIGAAFNDRDGG